MSETPNQIDLSWDIEQQVSGIQLSPEQKESFARFLEAKKQSEKEGILIITESELWELKNILDGRKELSSLSPEIQEKTKEGDVNSFIENQLTETVQLWEIYGDSELGKLFQWPNGPKLEQQIQSAAESLLSGEKWLFWEIGGISPDATFNLSTGLKLALIESFSKSPEKLAILKAALEGGESEVQKLVETFSGIQDNFSKYREQLKDINIAKNGEQNAIFMNPSEGKDFFIQLLDGKIENVKTYIESKNTTEPVAITPEQISKLQSEATIPAEAQEIIQEIENNPDKIQAFIEKMKEISPIIWGILEVLLGFVQGVRELLGNENETIQQAQELFSKMGEDEKSIFSDKKIPEDLFSSQEKENVAIKEQFTSLFGADAKPEEIQLFFQKNGKFQSFINAGNLPSIFASWGELSISLLWANLEAYKKYREENTKHNPTGVSGKNLLYSEYFSKLKGEAQE